MTTALRTAAPIVQQRCKAIYVLVLYLEVERLFKNNILHILNASIVWRYLSLRKCICAKNVLAGAFLFLTLSESVLRPSV